MGTFLEGVSVITQACTLVIGIPTAFLVLAARRSAMVVVCASLVATATVLWATAAGYWTLDNVGATRYLMAAAVVGAFGLAWRSSTTSGAVPWYTGTIGGAIAGWQWQPCVGAHLGDILNTARDQQARSLGLLIVYTAGALLPAIILAAGRHAWPALEPTLTHRRAGHVGLLFGIVYAATIASGQYNDLIGELGRISSA